MDDHKKALLKAYNDATIELRYLHDDQFHSILTRIYEERGLNINKRRSKKQAQKARVDAALELIRSQNII